MKSNVTKLIVGLFSLALLGGLFVAGTLVYFSMNLPKISSLGDYRPPLPSRIISKDGIILAELGKQNRQLAKFEEIPKTIINAFLSAEDDSFYEHSGVDYMGMFRAFIANLKAVRIAQGGSTITQQVAKSLLLSNERSISRKIKDILLAQRIEKQFTKEEILYLYLNQVYLGGGYYGVKSAFEGYFGKNLDEATIAEASMVAGLLVAPGRYSPYLNPKRAKIRQAYVLKRMLATNKITEEEYNQAVNEKIQYKLRKPAPFKAGYFTDWVRQRVVEMVGEEKFLLEGYTIETTLDYDLQKVAEESVRSTVKDIDKRQGFKGPLDHLEELTREEWRKKYLDAFYKEKSEYFTISEEKIKKYEFELDVAEIEDLKSYRSDFYSNMTKKKFHPGTSPNSRFAEFLKKGETYKGIVLDTDNTGRIVYVDVGGAVGIIPYEGFNWAHDRVIEENRSFQSLVTHPSTILKPGDVVLVTLESRGEKLLSQTNSNFKKVYNKLSNSEKALVNKQKYEVFILDQEPEVQGALVSLNPYTGETVSFVGGYDFSKSQFNRAIQSKRQPGSAFKPILFACALENGYTPASIIIDSPETLGGVDESLNWKPRNYDGKFKGPVTLRSSLEQSRNVPTVKIATDLGVEKILDFTDRIGFNAKLDEDLSLSLGSFGVTLMDIVSTYSIFPNGGKRIFPKSIVNIKDRFGNNVEFVETPDKLTSKNSDSPIEESDKAELKIEDDEEEVDAVATEKRSDRPEGQEEVKNPFLTALNSAQVYDRRLAYLMTNLLRGVVLHGTGMRAKHVSTYLGGKTGTTNNYVDAWFIGFSQKLATGVWTGFDENQTLGWGETGAKSALPAWVDFMRAGLRKYSEVDFRAPNGIVNVLIDKETGKPTRPGSPNAFHEAFVEGTEPGSENSSFSTKDNPDSNGPILEEDDYYSNQ